jgi:hypothetical protein
VHASPYQCHLSMLARLGILWLAAAAVAVSLKYGRQSSAVALYYCHGGRVDACAPQSVSMYRVRLQ